MISGFAPARLLRSAERVLRIQRGQDKAAGIAVQQQCCAVLCCRVLLATWSEMHVRACRSENPVSSRFSWGLRRACVKVRGGGRSALVGAGRTRLRTADVDLAADSRQVGGLGSAGWRYSEQVAQHN